MWKFLRQALALLPREIAWLIGVPFCFVALAIGCLFMVNYLLASGYAVPVPLAAVVRYAAGVKVIVVVAMSIAAMTLAMGLLGARIFSGMRNRP